MSDHADMDATTSTTPAGSLTRGQVAERLGISVASVRRREGKTLHPMPGPKGEWLFDPIEVEAERCRTAGQGGVSENDNDGVAPESGPKSRLREVPGEPSEADLSVVTTTPTSHSPQAGVLRTPACGGPAPAGDDPTAGVFRDLSAGHKLCDIVAERGISPQVVRHAYEQWLEFAQIDALRAPAGERRLFLLERTVEIHKDASDAMLEEIRSVRRRVADLEKATGVGSGVP